MSDPINDDDNDGVDDRLVDEDDDHDDFVHDVLIAIDIYDDDDDDDVMYDVLDNYIHLSSITFEWLNGIKKNHCQWFAICGKDKFCFVGQYSKLKSLSRPPFHIDIVFISIWVQNM